MNEYFETLCRYLHVKTTNDKPAVKHAPKWATALGQTPEGAWHWLEKTGPLETDYSDSYFPDSGKTEFTGFKNAKSDGIVISLEEYKEKENGKTN